MTLGNLRSVGPVTVSYCNPALTWRSEPNSHGIRSCTISGTLLRAEADQLAEMFAEPSDRRTIGGFTGILVWLDMDGDALVSRAGYYLVSSFDLAVEHRLVFADRLSFSMASAYLGDVA